MSTEAPRQRRLRHRRAAGLKMWGRIEKAAVWLDRKRGCVYPHAPWEHCCVCGALVKTCERKRPIRHNWVCLVHSDGAQMHDKRWVCSGECWEIAADDEGRFHPIGRTTDLPHITHVAVMHEGVTYSLERPARHCDVIRHIVQTTGCSRVAGGDAQGFIHPPTGKFMRRSAAARYAHRGGQITELKWPPLLYSEDLW